MKKKVVNAFVDFGLLDFVQNLKIPRASRVICGPCLMKWRSLISPLPGAKEKISIWN